MPLYNKSVIVLFIEGFYIIISVQGGVRGGAGRGVV